MKSIEDSLKLLLMLHSACLPERTQWLPSSSSYGGAWESQDNVQYGTDIPMLTELGWCACMYLEFSPLHQSSSLWMSLSRKYSKKTAEFCLILDEDV